MTTREFTPVDDLVALLHCPLCWHRLVAAGPAMLRCRPCRQSFPASGIADELIALRAPDGSTRPIPLSLVGHYKRLGAVEV